MSFRFKLVYKYEKLNFWFYVTLIIANKPTDQYELGKEYLLTAINSHNPAEIEKAIKNYEALPESENKRKEEATLLSVGRKTKENVLKKQSIISL